jgi:cell division septal protein FtsQ
MDVCLPRPRRSGCQHLLYCTLSGRYTMSASERGMLRAVRSSSRRNSPASARPRRRSRARRLILAGVALLILLVGFEIGIRQISPDAVQASAYTVDGGNAFATHHITDARIVADLYTRINNLPSVGYDAFYR